MADLLSPQEQAKKDVAEVSAEFADEIARVFQELKASQESLGSEAIKLWDNHVDELYEQ